MTFALIWPSKPGGYLFQRRVQIWLIDLYYYSRSLLDSIAFTIYDGTTFKTVSTSPTKKRRFQYVCWITTDNNTKHTKWQVMDVGIAVTHSERETKFMQRVLVCVCVYTHTRTVYVYTRYIWALYIKICLSLLLSPVMQHSFTVNKKRCSCIK
jgi:hypothetical protein